MTSCCVSFLQVSVGELEQTYSGVSEPAEEMIRVSFDSLTGCFFPSDVFETVDVMFTDTAQKPGETRLQTTYT